VSAPGTDADAARPWERPGAVRRDCQPHRGPALRLVGWAALAFGTGSFVFALAGAFFPAGPARVIRGSAALCVCLAVGLSAAGLWGTARDLARMSRGVMDPAGRPTTADAQGCARAGLLVGLGSLYFLFLAWQSVFG
jgi:hypothetical protein